MKKQWLCAAAACALLVSTAKAQSPPPAGADLTEAPRKGTWGYALDARDTSVKPGDDFYRYADGKGIDRLAIPPDRPSFGVFDVLVELSNARSRAVIASPGPTAAGSEEAKIKALYASFMDQDRMNALGLAPLQPRLAAIKAVKTRAQLALLMGQGASSFYPSVFGISVQVDAKDPKHYALVLSQAGLNLPDRDYYLAATFADKKAKYQAYLADTLARIGWPDAKLEARRIVAMESAIAQVSWTKAEQRDDVKMYNPMSPADLAKAAPGFPWKAFLRGAETPKVGRLIVSEKTAFPKIAAIYAKTPLKTLKAWAAVSMAADAAPYLTKTLDEAHFAFFGKELSGTPEQRTRDKRAASVVSARMGEALGRVYVDRFFPADSKTRMLSLIGDLKVALGERIKRLDWMSDATKQKALLKLSKFTVKVGYPNKWRDYTGLQIKPDDIFGNIERSQSFEWHYRIGRLNGPVDRGEWDMTPQTVNAYYDPTKNEIVFPAAILQPPFFDPAADPAVNYGGIGGVIGHEMTHGFDDEGRKFDGDGVLTDWWTPTDSDGFNARTKRLVDQYSAFEPLPGVKVKGDQTLGENIADLGGLLLALDAYHASLHGQPAPVIDGLTGDQRVFLGWAQGWLSKQRDDATRQQIVSDPHSPDMLRVNGVVRNIDSWYAAFDVKPGEKLYLDPSERVKIW